MKINVPCAEPRRRASETASFARIFMKKRDPLRRRNRRRLWSRRSTDVWQVCFLSRKEALLSGASPFVPRLSILLFLPTLPVPTRSCLNSIYGRCSASETIVPSTGGYLYLDRCRFIRFQDNIPPFDPVRGNKLSSTRKRFSQWDIFKNVSFAKSRPDLYKENPRREMEDSRLIFYFLSISLIRTVIIYIYKFAKFRTNRNLQGTVQLEMVAKFFKNPKT